MPLLLGSNVATDMATRLPGLLIGLEIAGMGIDPDQKITLVSHGELAKRYEMALNVTGLSFQRYDSEEMVCAGLCHIARTLQSRFVC